GLTNFNGGITAYASSTIGNGTQAGGLTISGGATTTGNAYFAGNVGIGVAAPTQKLTVAGGGIKLDNAQNIYWRNSANTADTAVFTLSGDTTILRGGGGTPTLQLQNSGGTPVETLLENGTVGIGTTSPYGKISISGPDTGAGFAFALADSANAPVFTIQDNGIFTYGKNSTSTIPNNTPYAWTIATSTTGAPLFSISTVSGSELTTIGVPNSNVFIGDVGAPANLVFQESSTIETSGGKTLTIGAGSDIVNFGVNVGIGSTTPATTLSVSGNGYFTGGVGIGIENNTAGTLQTSGNGLFGGSVGVGTATPLSALTVNGGTTIGADYNTAAPTNGLLVEGKVGIGTTSPASNFTVVGSLLAATSSALTGFLASFVNTAGNTNSNGIAIEGGSNSTKGAALISFYRPDGTNIGGVTQTSATAVAYNTTSDRRVKEDIATTTSGLAQLLQIPVRDFDYINDPAHATTTGFIAQELYSVFPEAVTTNGDNGTVPLMPGQTPWQVDYGRITPLIVKSVQDLAASSVRISNGIVNFSNAATTTIAIGSGTWTIATSSATGTLPIISISAPASSTPSVSINGVLYVNGQNIASAIASTTGATSTPAALVAGPFATSTPTLQNALFTMLNALSGVAQSGVRELGVAVHASAGIFDSLVTQTLTATTINADTVNASQKLCIGTTCVTESQLQQLLGSSQSAGNNGSANSGSGSGSSPSGQSLVASSSDTVAPTVTLNGDNPATITVGDTYADLGASVSDTGVGQAGNANLGLSVSVDGGATTTPSQIIINTSSAGTHTIIYSAVDQNGLTGSATRTVNVVAQDASSTPAN
ncbi:MAG TPA: tail fiber domain-containing protein, partial [Candidatus Paceibacterota bacterium]|nr:tail fiber domain-containing protein [Candidatus Paceibacterota bacterium]